MKPPQVMRNNANADLTAKHEMNEATIKLTYCLTYVTFLASVFLLLVSSLILNCDIA